ncbi:unnamed protein product [Paramecium sonneborni]|uniref:Uncharacterized protein n=1 Tax=Paramecium sonneborni TaxID=65129 RepID=A0A8S1NBK8_9CILI|nr:unnamed protein product [Paramecium sonneborni]
MFWDRIRLSFLKLLNIKQFQYPFFCTDQQFIIQGSIDYSRED